MACTSCRPSRFPPERMSTRGRNGEVGEATLSSKSRVLSECGHCLQYRVVGSVIRQWARGLPGRTLSNSLRLICIGFDRTRPKREPKMCDVDGDGGPLLVLCTICASGACYIGGSFKTETDACSGPGYCIHHYSVRPSEIILSCSPLRRALPASCGLECTASASYDGIAPSVHLDSLGVQLSSRIPYER